MPKFAVHAYASVRVKITDIEAETNEQALARASERLGEINLYDRFETDLDGVVTEYAEEITDYLVDRVDDQGETVLSSERFWDLAHVHSVLNDSDKEAWSGDQLLIPE